MDSKFPQIRFRNTNLYKEKFTVSTDNSQLSTNLLVFQITHFLLCLHELGRPHLTSRALV